MLALGEVFALTEHRQGLLDVSVGLSMLKLSETCTWDLLGKDGCSPGVASQSVTPVFVGTLPEALKYLDQGLIAMRDDAPNDLGVGSFLHTIFISTTNRITGFVAELCDTLRSFRAWSCMTIRASAYRLACLPSFY